MLYSIRSTINNKVDFKKGDKFVTANVINNDTIEYVINRPVKTYVLRSNNLTKFIRKDEKNKKAHYKTVDIVEEATFFKTYKAAKEFSLKYLDGNNLGINIIEVTD